MKRFKNAVFSALNVLVIAGILLFILAGLVKIGIFEAPAFFKNIFKNEQHENTHDIGSVEDFLDSPVPSQSHTVHSAKLNPENVKNMLSGLKIADQYSHDVHYSVISDKSTLTRRAYIMKKDNIHCAFYLSDNGNVEKQMIRNDSFTSVNTIKGGKLNSTVYSNGNIDFASQTGIILTHEDFYAAADEPGYTFSINYDDFGTVMLIEFTSSMGEYSQLQKYTLSLDYGIVTEARCYENEKLIYELTTNSLSSDLTPNFAVPAEFTANLPTGFAAFESAPSENQ